MKKRLNEAVPVPRRNRHEVYFGNVTVYVCVKVPIRLPNVTRRQDATVQSCPAAVYRRFFIII